MHFSFVKWHTHILSNTACYIKPYCEGQLSSEMLNSTKYIFKCNFTLNINSRMANVEQTNKWQVMFTFLSQFISIFSFLYLRIMPIMIINSHNQSFSIVCHVFIFFILLRLFSINWLHPSATTSFHISVSTYEVFFCSCKERNILVVWSDGEGYITSLEAKVQVH